MLYTDSYDSTVLRVQSIEDDTFIFTCFVITSSLIDLKITRFCFIITVLLVNIMYCHMTYFDV